MLFLPLNVDKNNILDNKTIYSGPRVGLTLKKPHKLREEYIMKNYRFIIFPNAIKKFKSGIIINLHHKKYNVSDIERITGTKYVYIEKYINYAKEGKLKNIKEFHKKKLSSMELCMLQGLKI